MSICANYEETMRKYASECDLSQAELTKRLRPIVDICPTISQNPDCAIALQEQARCLLRASKAEKTFRVCHRTPYDMPLPYHPCFDEYRIFHETCVNHAKSPIQTQYTTARHQESIKNLQAQADKIRKRASIDLSYLLDAQRTANDEANKIALSEEDFF